MAARKTSRAEGVDKDARKLWADFLGVAGLGPARREGWEGDVRLRFERTGGFKSAPGPWEVFASIMADPEGGTVARVLVRRSDLTARPSGPDSKRVAAAVCRAMLARGYTGGFDPYESWKGEPVPNVNRGGFQRRINSPAELAEEFKRLAATDIAAALGLSSAR